MSWIGWAIALAVVFNVVRSVKSASSRSSPIDANASRIQKNRQIIADMQSRGIQVPASAYAAAGLATRLPPPVPARAAATTTRPTPARSTPEPPALSGFEDPLPEHLLNIGMRRTGALHGFFEDGKSVRRAVIAAEIFGPPVALKERTPWQI